jgi:hypothetical protein
MNPMDTRSTSILIAVILFPSIFFMIQIKSEARSHKADGFRIAARGKVARPLKKVPVVTRAGFKGYSGFSRRSKVEPCNQVWRGEKRLEPFCATVPKAWPGAKHCSSQSA